jgi:hypothetical protein
VRIHYREVFTMLGEKIGQSSGRITGTRLVPVEGGGVKVEVSFQGSGTVLGMAATEMCTYTQSVLPGGALHGEGHTLFTTAEGEMALWQGGGVGAATGPAPAAKFGVYGRFVMATPGLAKLQSVAVVTEFEVHQDGTYEYESWEWK